MYKYACWLFSRLIPIQTSVRQTPLPPNILCYHPIFLNKQVQTAIQKIIWFPVFLTPLGPSQKTLGRFVKLPTFPPQHFIHLPLTLHLLFYFPCSWGWSYTLAFSGLLCCLACVEGCHSWVTYPHNTWHLNLCLPSVILGFLGDGHLLPD